MGRPWDPVKAAKDIKKSMESAVDNLIEEIKKPIPPELTGAARKAELQAIKQASVDARELLQERMRMEKMIQELERGDDPSQEKEFKTGFAEEFSKRS